MASRDINKDKRKNQGEIKAISIDIKGTFRGYLWTKRGISRNIEVIKKIQRWYKKNLKS